MTDDEQWGFLEAQEFEVGYDLPHELRIREAAKRAVEDPTTYVTGYLIPVRAERIAATTSQARDHKIIEVRLIPALQDRPDIAQLVAEDTIRKEWLR